MKFLYKYLIYGLFIFTEVKDNEALRCYVCKDCTEISDDYIQTCGTDLSTTTSVPSTTLIDDAKTTTEEHKMTTDENEEVIVVTTPENIATTTQIVITTVESVIDSTSQYPIETTSSSTENLASTTEVTTQETIADTEGTTQEPTETVTESTTEGTTQETTEGITDDITERSTLETPEMVTEETTEEITTDETTEITIQEITEGTTYETAETVTEEITEETSQETTANTILVTMVTEDTGETTVATSEEQLVSEARPLQEVLSSFEPEHRTRESLVSRDATVPSVAVGETTNKNNKENTQRMMVNSLTGNRLQLPVNSRKFRSVISSFRSTLSRDTSEELEPRCIVAHYTENDEAKIIRGCSFESSDVYARCREAIGFDGEMSKCKLCDTDLCNSVSAPVVQLALILICTVIVTSF